MSHFEDIKSNSEVQVFGSIFAKRMDFGSLYFFYQHPI